MILDVLGSSRLPITLVSGEGALMWDTDGRTYWDFYGGHAVTFIGQAHPTWVDALHQQAKALSFMTGLADVPVRRRAAAALTAFTGYDLCWLVNSGAEANEAALKIARKATGRQRIIAFEKGFHGRTMGALGVTWKLRDQHGPAHGDVIFLPYGDLEAIRAALDETVAAVMVEPIQGIGGIVVPDPTWLPEVQRLAHANGSLLICDEVQSGLGRTGWPLDQQRVGVKADVTTVGKGLGGGFPVAAILLDRALGETVLPGEHGTTFGGAPLACAAIEATFKIILEENLLEKSRALGERMKATLARVPGVVETRGFGAWIGVKLDRPAGPVMKALIERGFLCGTSSDPTVLRLSPPAVMPLWVVDQLAKELGSLLGAGDPAVPTAP
jgi:acetylornithine/succinyldiaminopimelate/putrescine aminotransferase